VDAERADLGIVDSLVQLSFLVQSVLGKAAARHDLTVSQLRLLGILRDREPSMIQLAQHLGLDKSSVTGLIDRAERRGLVKRTPSRADGRAVHVSATSSGRDASDRLSSEIAGELNTLAAGLSAADRRTLASLASRIISGHPSPAASARGVTPGAAEPVAAGLFAAAFESLRRT
jgi:MarR family transcriptional regulator, lower aerobic nicotinate degradation pathway regulator